MKIKSVAYSMLRVVAQFENDRVEITVELDKDDKLETIIPKLKQSCEQALKQRSARYCECGNTELPFG